MRPLGYRAWPPQADLELAAEGQRWLHEYDRTRSGGAPSPKTVEEYGKALKRMLDRGLRPESMAGTKASFYYLRAAVLFHSAKRLRETLPKLDAAAKGTPTDEATAAWNRLVSAVRGAVEAMRRYPPGEPEVFVVDGRRCPWDPSMTDESIRQRSRSNDVEAVQAALPKGWMETLWRTVTDSRTKYLDAIAVELSTGCRRQELLMGVRVATDGKRLRIMVRGAKTNSGHGRKLRVAAIDRPVHSWHDHLIDQALSEGVPKGNIHVLEVQVGNVNTYTGVFSSLADKCGFWRLPVWTAARTEPQPFRDALAAMLATGWSAEKVAAGVAVEPAGDGVVIRPLKGRGRSHVVAAPIEPWEANLAKLAAEGTVEITVPDANGFPTKVRKLKAASPVASITPYVVRHAISAARKAETRLPPDRLAAMTAAERDAYEKRRREEVARTLGHASTRTQSGYGAPWHSKGSTGITATRGTARDRRPAGPKPEAKPET